MGLKYKITPLANLMIQKYISISSAYVLLVNDFGLTHWGLKKISAVSNLNILQLFCTGVQLYQPSQISLADISQCIING